MYFEAAKSILGSGYDAELWLDCNSNKLSMKINTIEEAKTELNSLIEWV